MRAVQLYWLWPLLCLAITNMLKRPNRITITIPDRFDVLFFFLIPKYCFFILIFSYFSRDSSERTKTILISIQIQSMTPKLPSVNGPWGWSSGSWIHAQHCERSDEEVAHFLLSNAHGHCSIRINHANKHPPNTILYSYVCFAYALLTIKYGIYRAMPESTPFHRTANWLKLIRIDSFAVRMCLFCWLICGLFIFSMFNIHAMKLDCVYFLCVRVFRHSAVDLAMVNLHFTHGWLVDRVIQISNIDICSFTFNWLNGEYLRIGNSHARQTAWMKSRLFFFFFIQMKIFQ